MREADGITLRNALQELLEFELSDAADADEWTIRALKVGDLVSVEGERLLSKSDYFFVRRYLSDFDVRIAIPSYRETMLKGMREIIAELARS